MQRGRCANGEIRQRHVVINGAHKPDNSKMSMLSRLIISDFLCNRGPISFIYSRGSILSYSANEVLRRAWAILI